MLNIRTKYYGGIDIYFWEWNNTPKIISKTGIGCLPDVGFSDVEIIEANGEELKIILADFHNIPYIHGTSIMTWYGEWAQFIYKNLCNKYNNG